MIKQTLIALAVTAGLTVPVAISVAAPQERREERREYHFRDQDGNKLREHYHANFREHDRIEPEHRVVFRVGERLPDHWRERVHPVPEVVLRELPPIPAGLAIGYLDGYAVVYDPATGVIVETLDVY